MWPISDDDWRRFKHQLVALVVVVLVLTLALGILIGSRASGAELTGSQVLTLEHSDVGDVYAAASIVLEAAIAPAWSVVVIHDQAAQWPGARYAEWDASLVWRPGPGWSVSAGRRWRIGSKPDYGGPWTYVQVWRGM